MPETGGNPPSLQRHAERPPPLTQPNERKLSDINDLRLIEPCDVIAPSQKSDYNLEYSQNSHGKGPGQRVIGGPKYFPKPTTPGGMGTFESLAWTNALSPIHCPPKPSVYTNVWRGKGP